jgi:hypothetical protein
MAIGTAFSCHNVTAFDTGYFISTSYAMVAEPDVKKP